MYPVFVTEFQSFGEVGQKYKFTQRKYPEYGMEGLLLK